MHNGIQWVDTSVILYEFFHSPLTPTIEWRIELIIAIYDSRLSYLAL